jgi:hypothetical protein
MNKQTDKPLSTLADNPRPERTEETVEDRHSAASLDQLRQAPPPILRSSLLSLQRHVGNRAITRAMASVASAPPSSAPQRSAAIQRLVQILPEAYIEQHVDNTNYTEAGLKPILADYFEAPVGTGGSTFREQLDQARRSAGDNAVLTHLMTLEDIYAHQYGAGEFLRAQAFLQDIAEYANEILNQADQDDLGPAIPKLNQAQPLNETFSDKVDQIKPDWIAIRAYGAKPREKHAFVYRFTNINEAIWQKSHLGKEIDQNGLSPNDLEKPPNFPPGRVSKEEQAAIRKKREIAKRWQTLQGLLNPGGKFGFTQEAKMKIREKPNFVKTRLPEYAELVEQQHSFMKEYATLREAYEMTYAKLPDTAREVQNLYDENKNTLPLPQKTALEPIYMLSGKIHFNQADIEKLAEEIRLFKHLPTNVAEAAEFLAYLTKMDLALKHFGGETDHSLFVSTAADYQLTAKSDDRVMQSIIRSDENLESTKDWDFSTGRSDKKQRALHLVMYEIPLNLLVSPEQVEEVKGLGSSENEGLVAMRNIKERLFLGDNLGDYIVAVAPNPY